MNETLEDALAKVEVIYRRMDGPRFLDDKTKEILIARCPLTWWCLTLFTSWRGTDDSFKLWKKPDYLPKGLAIWQSLEESPAIQFTSKARNEPLLTKENLWCLKLYKNSSTNCAKKQKSPPSARVLVHSLESSPSFLLHFAYKIFIDRSPPLLPLPFFVVPFPPWAFLVTFLICPTIPQQLSTGTPIFP